MSENSVSLQLFDGIVMMHMRVYAYVYSYRMTGNFDERKI